MKINSVAIEWKDWFVEILLYRWTKTCHFNLFSTLAQYKDVKPIQQAYSTYSMHTDALNLAPNPLTRVSRRNNSTFLILFLISQIKHEKTAKWKESRTQGLTLNRLNFVRSTVFLSRTSTGSCLLSFLSILSSQSDISDSDRPSSVDRTSAVRSFLCQADSAETIESKRSRTAFARSARSSAVGFSTTVDREIACLNIDDIRGWQASNWHWNSC